MVTGTPSRFIAWANSTAIGPPPTMPSERGRSGRRSSESLVRNGTDDAPAMGGVAGAAPTASTVGTPSMPGILAVEQQPLGP